MQNKMPEIPIHDIKPLVEIQEYSFYYLLALIVLALVVLGAIIYMIIRYVKSKKAFNIRKEHSKILHDIDFKDAKKSAYDITFYGATFKNDSQKHHDMYENMTDRLAMYKYKKSVDSMDDEVKAYVDLYRGMIDV